MYDKLSYTDLSIVQHIVQNRINNENNSFDDSSKKSSKDNTEKESKIIGMNFISNSKSIK